MATEKLVHKCDFDSLAEYVKACQKNETKIYGEKEPDWNWIGAADKSEVYNLAANGWDKDLDATLQIAEEAIKTVEDRNEVPAWHPVWDVSGASVDVGVLMTGEPEHMVDIPPVMVSKYGRVITLCVSRSCSGGVKPENIIRKGQILVALAYALERLGYGLEIYTDDTITGCGGGCPAGSLMRTRVCVKGVHEVIDPKALMFALAHPAYLRWLNFGAEWETPAEIREHFGIRPNGTYGTPHNPVEDLPEGTIYTECSCSAEDYDTATALERYLRELDILA